MNKAIFFDRDGVLIKPIIVKERPFSISRMSQLEFIINDKTYFDELRKYGYKLIIITNQPDVARGEISRTFVDEVNSMIVKKFALDGCYVCDHDNDDECLCRKPKNGLLLNAARDFNLDLSKCIMIGDRWKDIDAAEISGCKSIFIDYNYNEKKPTNFTLSTSSLLEAIKKILEKYEQ